jgi:hypothetical protein
MAARRKRTLRDPLLGVLLCLEEAREILRTLASNDLSPLPERFRTRLAAMVVRIGYIRRHIERNPDRITAERDRELGPSLPLGEDESPCD